MADPTVQSSPRLKRLFVEASLDQGAHVALATSQAHYLRNVLRLRDGDEVLLFNGRDGEWRARLTLAGRRGVAVEPAIRTRAQQPTCDLDYLFAPLKHARLDYMAQKATEMGARRLRPVLTARTTVSRVNLDRLRANAIEAAEQCGLVSVPEIIAPERLETVIDSWPSDRALIFADETEDADSPVAKLSKLSGRPLALLVGPEGGFDAEERARLRALPETIAISLGPRIIRADTAAVAALALIQAIAGDWKAGGL